MDCDLSYFSLARLLSHSSLSSFAQHVEFVSVFKKNHLSFGLTFSFLDFVFASFSLSFYTGQDYLLCT